MLLSTNLDSYAKMGSQDLAGQELAGQYSISFQGIQGIRQLMMFTPNFIRNKITSYVDHNY